MSMDCFNLTYHFSFSNWKKSHVYLFVVSVAQAFWNSEMKMFFFHNASECSELIGQNMSKYLLWNVSQKLLTQIKTCGFYALSSVSQK